MNKSFFIVLISLIAIGTSTLFSCKQEDSFELNYDAVILASGESFNLTGTLITTGDSNVSWSIIDDNPQHTTGPGNTEFLTNQVATITDQGVIQGLEAGTATVTAKAAGITRTCKVTVIDWDWSQQSLIKDTQNKTASLEITTNMVSLPLKVIPTEVYVNESTPVTINDYLSFNPIGASSNFFEIKNGMLQVKKIPPTEAKNQCKFKMTTPDGINKSRLGITPLVLTVSVEISDTISLNND